jgi:hypothetical protein
VEPPPQEEGAQGDAMDIDQPEQRQQPQQPVKKEPSMKAEPGKEERKSEADGEQQVKGENSDEEQHGEGEGEEGAVKEEAKEEGPPQPELVRPACMWMLLAPVRGSGSFNMQRSTGRRLCSLVCLLLPACPASWLRVWLRCACCN